MLRVLKVLEKLLGDIIEAIFRCFSKKWRERVESWYLVVCWGSNYWSPCRFAGYIIRGGDHPGVQDRRTLGTVRENDARETSIGATGRVSGEGMFRDSCIPTPSH